MEPPPAIAEAHVRPHYDALDWLVTAHMPATLARNRPISAALPRLLRIAPGCDKRSSPRLDVSHDGCSANRRDQISRASSSESARLGIAVDRAAQCLERPADVGIYLQDMSGKLCSLNQAAAGQGLLTQPLVGS